MWRDEINRTYKNEKESMMRNKKYILIALMSCVVLGTLTACTGSSVNQFVKMVQQADEKERWKNEHKISLR